MSTKALPSRRVFTSRLSTSSVQQNPISTARPYRCLSCRLSPPGRLISRAHTSRQFHTASPLLAAPKSKDRGPKSEEDTQTDFGDLNVLRSVPAPSTAIDACTNNGFHLNSGTKIIDSGVLLVSGQAFNWKPWLKEDGREGTIAGGGGTRKQVNAKGQWEVQDAAWGVLGAVWPKPDLLIIGTGPTVLPISPATRKSINDLGIRVEIQDTRNAASQFNLLATERGLQQVAAAMIPVGWKEGRLGPTSLGPLFR